MMPFKQLKGDINLLILMNNNNNPYFNLASEEYILNHYREDCFMLWRNQPSIIVGKNQNTIAEINVDYVKEHQIPVVRRLSGGGAVFHDFGNLNFTFIKTDAGKSFSDFRGFTEPILEVLRSLGVNAEFSGRNDLTIDGKKFSGNAQYKHHDRTLHHGTLLFTSEIADLSAALRPRASKFDGKSVQSVISRVTNIQEHLTHLDPPMDLDTFQALIQAHVIKKYGADAIHPFNDADIAAINKLVEQKYGTWEWNFGKSPEYSYQKEKKFAGGLVEIHLDVRQGIIQKAKIFGDFFSRSDIKDIEDALLGQPHDLSALRSVYERFAIGEAYLTNITIEDLLEISL
jgi:lipoate-protein ligase A